MGTFQTSRGEIAGPAVFDAKLQRAGERPGSPANGVFAGDSAGGALAVSALVEARGQGLPMPAAAIAISPWANLEHTGATMFSLDGVDPSVGREGLRRAAEIVLGRAPAKCSGPTVTNWAAPESADYCGPARPADGASSGGAPATPAPDPRHCGSGSAPPQPCPSPRASPGRRT